jgi:hypothetical protein
LSAQPKNTTSPTSNAEIPVEQCHETKVEVTTRQQPNQPQAFTTKIIRCIVDRIYTGDPASGCDMFFHHHAAMEAAKTWDPETSTPYSYHGGHLLPRQPLFQKGDKVQVQYNEEWWEATILRRTSQAHGFKYQVHYSDRTKQSGVDEQLIRNRPSEKNSRVTAAEIGLGEGWTASVAGNNRWKITSPEGETYFSKKSALEAYQLVSAQDMTGDPPWRTADNEYVGRKVYWTSVHKVSARRSVTVEQVGTYRWLVTSFAALSFLVSSRTTDVNDSYFIACRHGRGLDQ